MSVKNYKIYLFECKNIHKKNDILYKDLESTQMIDLMNIKFAACKDSNKYNTYQNQFYKCFDCNINLCPLCNKKHDKIIIYIIMIKLIQYVINIMNHLLIIVKYVKVIYIIYAKKNIMSMIKYYLDK